MKKVLLVFGTRPEAIKMAPLLIELKKNSACFETKVCVTAQHRKMLDQVLEVFEIVPDFDLNLMASDQDLFDITAKVLLGLRDVINRFTPDIILVHGDTTTSMAAALAAFYKKIKIGHVEAGLRTYKLESPWPEEMNRQVTDKLADFYFAPTEKAKSNLINEGVPSDKILVSGNTVIDALYTAVNLLENNEERKIQVINKIEDSGFPIRSSCFSQKRDFILVTGHRRENFGEGFQNICMALKTIAHKYSNIDIVYPVHLNPNVQEPVYTILKNVPNLYLVPPMDYLPFVLLMKHSYLLLTDSGGVQEEAPSLGKPVLVMRDNTERPEGLASGSVRLVGTKVHAIIDEIENLIMNTKLYRELAVVSKPYGNGHASEYIVRYLVEHIND
ncbi:MAG: UDP-N-acetylglucosamine 2-epimerase (non-hydrolyzing) [Bacteroidales bacterium]